MMPRTLPMNPPRHTGFTLVEMGIVLMIMALLLGGLLPTITSQVEQRRESDTSKQLDEIQQALIGYAIIHGSLPCPASGATGTGGQEDPITGTGVCNHPHDNKSYVPAVTLGLSGADSNGLIEDAWGNPIHYAIANGSSNTFPFTKPNGISGIGIANIGNSSIANLDVCSKATGSTNTACGSNYTLTNDAVAVIYSTGKNGANGTGAGPDEQENPTANSTDNDTVYVSATPSPTFDDMVIWLSPNILVNRMVSAGKLP